MAPARRNGEIKHERRWHLRGETGKFSMRGETEKLSLRGETGKLSMRDAGTCETKQGKLSMRDETGKLSKLLTAVLLSLF